MIEQNTRVTAVDAQSICLQTEPQSTGCHSCQLNSGCGTGLLARLFPKQLPHRLQLPARASTASVNIGDRVVLGISERYLYQAIVLLYAVPLIGLIAGAVLGALAGEYLLDTHAMEPASIIAGLLGLSAGIAYAHYRSAHPGDALEQHVQVLKVTPGAFLSANVRTTQSVDK